MDNNKILILYFTPYLKIMSQVYDIGSARKIAWVNNSIPPQHGIIMNKKHALHYELIAT